MSQIFQSARFIAANAREAPILGERASLKGTLLDESVKKAIAAVSDATSNEMWPAVSNLSNPPPASGNLSASGPEFVGSPPLALSTPVGDFIVYFAQNARSGERVGVAVNPTAHKSGIFDELGTSYSAAGDRLSIAALWATRAYEIAADGEGLSILPLDDKTTVKPMAVGVLHAVELFVSHEPTPTAPTKLASAMGSSGAAKGSDQQPRTPEQIQKQLSQALAATPTLNAEADQTAQRIPTPQAEPAAKWYAADINKTTCVAAHSPADRIREIQDAGETAKTTDLPGGAEEVGSDIGGDRFRYWTIYPSRQACIDALPRSQHVPSRYE